MILENRILSRVYDVYAGIYYGKLLSREEVVRRKFRKRLGRELEMDKPLRFNDKIQWLKLNWNDRLAALCSDKLEVREVIRTRIGEEYLNDLYHVYDEVGEINLDELPDKFVLKVTHGSGYNVICKDKSEMDWKREFRKLRRWLSTDYSLKNGEWVYGMNKPRIICEKYLEEAETGELRDYKFFCFSGEPKIMVVDYNRYRGHCRNLYDLEWNLIEGKINAKYPRDDSVAIAKPEKLEEMIMLAGKLAKGFPHVRVDFYYLEERIVFGELTFFNGSGCSRIVPDELELQMGKWLVLPGKKSES